MRKFKKSSLIVALLLLTAATAIAAKPNIHVLATGGTIAGTANSTVATNYTPAQVAIGALLDEVPELCDIANVTGEQVVQIASQDMTDEIWLTLAKRVNELLKRPDIDGVVITHGTDTMEETAYFLNLTIKSDKPVVLVGAMRPSTALSADGPLNLFNAVVVASAKDSKGRGALVAMNDLVLGAGSVVKMNTTDVQAFQAPSYGALGYVNDGQVVFNHVTLKKHTTQSVFDVTHLDALPKVGVVYGYSNIDPDMVTPILNSGYGGIVYAGVGNGNVHKNVFPVLNDARSKGIVVVRSSRVPTGPTTLDAEVDDDKYQFVASEELSPQKSRVLLMLALTKTTNWQQIQQYFSEY